MRLLSLECLDFVHGGTIQNDGNHHSVLVPLDQEPHSIRSFRQHDQTVLNLEPGQIVLAPAGTWSNWSWRAPFFGVMLRLEPKGMQEFVQSEIKVLVDARQHGRPIIVTDTALYRIAGNMKEEVRHNYVGRDATLDAFARLFVVMLVRNHVALASENSQAAGRLNPDQFQALCEFIDARMGEAIRVDDLAVLVGVSLSSLQRKLSDATGLTPVQFIADRRLKRAKFLIESTSRKIGTIAFECGFSDQSHLTRAFKKRFGHSPLHHRKHLLDI